jgi:hypothetical protein
MGLRFLHVAPFVAALASVGCESGESGAITTIDASGGTPADSGGAIDASPADQGAADQSAGDAAAPAPSFAFSYVRLANWSLNAPPVDVCLAPHGTTAFEGPLMALQLGKDAGASDGGGELVSFPQLSAYLPVTPQAYDARLVVAGATSCSTNLVPDVLDVPALGQGGGYATLALMGDLAGGTGATGIRMVGMADDVLAPDLGHVEIRFVHAASNSPPVNVSAGDLQMLKVGKLFSNVPFGSVTTPAEAKATAPADAGASVHVDDAGYRTLSPQLPWFFGVQAAGATAPEASGVMQAAGGSIVTVVLLPTSLLAVDSGVPALELLECVDNGAGFTPLSDCFLLPPS